MPPSLFSPVKLGRFELPNRIAMAPLTRGDAGPDGLANELMAEHYALRADAGLIITEGTIISAQGEGWWGAPRIYRPEDVAAWKLVADAVHAKGGHIFCQLWHCGRASHSSFRPDAADGRGVAPSPIKIEGHEMSHTPTGRVPHEVPRELSAEEVPDISEEFGRAAQLAKEAGFDGVEVGGANGYILDTFMQSKTNKRVDKYGGSFENRFRIVQETLDAVLNVFPADRVGIRTSPNSTFNDTGSPDFRDATLYYCESMSPLRLAHLHVIDGVAFGFHGLGEQLKLREIRKVYDGVLIGNCGYDKKSADEAVASGDADLIAFGHLFINNPDLVARWAKGVELNPPVDGSLMYDSHALQLGAKGYSDVPMLKGSN
jgi:N-ethylmaleimide reductase